ncbi:MAG: riboflavin biosynthesis protein RibF [Bacilli bacterium]|nr:riboflavin biosynthesis protein RibF [Bacilli bacterium]
MELIKFDLEKQYSLPPLVAALGHFDGLHLAHQRLIEKTMFLAKSEDARSAVITFDPHPDYVLKKRKPAGYLTPLTDKAEAIAAMGVDYLIVVPFTLEISRLTSDDFENAVLDKFNIKKIVIGFDYRYGFQGRGNDATLRRKYPVYVLEAITYQNEKMGSDAVRRMLMDGHMEAVRDVLGKYYQISGKVVSGHRIGRTYGIRTANVDIPADYQPLKIGVYAVIVTVRGCRYHGVANYGIKPTFKPSGTAKLEVHIIDFSETIYNEEITVEFVRYIREEKPFPDVAALAAQIRDDIETVKKMKVEL